MVRWSSVAALLCLLLGSLYFFRPVDAEKPVVVSATVTPGTYKAVLYTGNGRKFELSDSVSQGIGDDVYGSFSSFGKRKTHPCSLFHPVCRFG